MAARGRLRPPTPMTDFTFDVPGSGAVSALFDSPTVPWLVYVLAHGAGAGMRHQFLERTAAALAARGIATLRYQFPYMEKRKNRPDPPHIAERAVRAAVVAAAERLPGVPLVAGGKSFGGRMTSQAQAADAMRGVRGLAFLGFPLHAPGRPGDKRAAHLFDVRIPLLFLQGTRDSLADLDLMRGVVKRMGKRATLYIVDEGDHSFKVPKRAGRTEDEIMTELADAIATWGKTLLA